MSHSPNAFPGNDTRPLNTDVAAPLYISMGPPCAGKTTWLKHTGTVKLDSQNFGSASNAVVDIALDNQPNVYIPLPVEMFLSTASEISSADQGSDILENQNRHDLWNQTFFGQTVAQRIAADNQLELRVVLQRLAGKISKQEMDQILRKLHRQSKFRKPVNNQSGKKNKRIGAAQQPTKASGSNETDTAASNSHSAMDNVQDDSEVKVSTLVDAVEALFHDGCSHSQPEADNGTSPSVHLPILVDLFVPEALYQKDGLLQKISGIERATQELQSVPRDTPVAWGNTNTRPQDYLVALECAERQRRPVYFCVYDAGHLEQLGLETNATSRAPEAMDNDGSQRQQYAVGIFDLPYIRYDQLIERSLRRLLHTGRYVPSQVIWETSERVRKLTSDVILQLAQQRAWVHHISQAVPSSQLPTKIELDSQLARLMQYQMQQDRTVNKIVRNTHYKDRQRFPSGSGSAQPPNRWNENQSGRHIYDPRQQHIARGRGAGGRARDNRPYYDSGRSGQGQSNAPRQQHQSFDRKSHYNSTPTFDQQNQWSGGRHQPRDYDPRWLSNFSRTLRGRGRSHHQGRGNSTHTGRNYKNDPSDSGEGRTKYE